MSLTDTLIRTFGMQLSSVSVIPGLNGVFDVRVGDELVWSKKRPGDFPTTEHVLTAVRRHLGAG